VIEGPNIALEFLAASGDTSPGTGGPVLGAYQTRKVLFIAPHPTDPKRRMYQLDCGHTVDRPAQGNKVKAICTKCPRRKHSREAG
jgi:hypothetical protein